MYHPGLGLALEIQDHPGIGRDHGLNFGAGEFIVPVLRKASAGTNLQTSLLAVILNQLSLISQEVMRSVYHLVILVMPPGFALPGVEAGFAIPEYLLESVALRPNGIMPKDEGYRVDERRVYQDGFNDSNATLF